MQPTLTPTENDVAYYFARGHSRRKVAAILQLSENAVKERLASVREKYTNAGRPTHNRDTLRDRVREDRITPTEFIDVAPPENIPTDYNGPFSGMNDPVGYERHLRITGTSHTAEQINAHPEDYDPETVQNTQAWQDTIDPQLHIEIPTIEYGSPEWDRALAHAHAVIDAHNTAKTVEDLTAGHRGKWIGVAVGRAETTGQLVHISTRPDDRVASIADGITIQFAHGIITVPRDADLLFIED